MFVLDPTSWSSSATAALLRSLEQGDRVVLGGRPPAKGVLRALLGDGTVPQWSSAVAGVARPVLDVPEVHGVTTTISRGRGTYAGPGAANPSIPAAAALLSSRSGTLALVARRSGSLMLLASSSPLQNGSLTRADNAAFGVDLAGPDGSTVAFDEYDHGFGRAGDGLAGLPASWRFGLGFALVAVVVWMLSASRRFGPPEEPGRIVVPARVQYVDAVATLLSARPREQLVEALDPVRAEARRRLGRRLGLGPGVTDDALVEAASHDSRRGSLDLPDEVVEAVVNPGGSTDDLIALGRALAWLERQDAYP